jgi:hypothetical protein
MSQWRLLLVLGIDSLAPPPPLQRSLALPDGASPRGLRLRLQLAFITTFPTPPFPPRPLSVRQLVVVGVRCRCDLARILELDLLCRTRLNY